MFYLQQFSHQLESELEAEAAAVGAAPGVAKRLSDFLYPGISPKGTIVHLYSSTTKIDIPRKPYYNNLAIWHDH